MKVVPLSEGFPGMGQKAARLRHMAALGLPVPEAYVVTGQVGEELDAELTAEVRQLMATVFAGARVVVRSSASDEDRAIAVAPGVYDSFLGLSDADEVLRAIRLCVEGLRSGAALAYRRLHGLESDQTAMAVIIQRLVECETSGVMFTRDPVRETPSMLVETVRGFGTDLVGGAGGHHTFRLPRLAAWTKPRSWTVSEDGLPDVLNHLGHVLEAEFGTHQDIEFGVADGQLHVFQCRDIVAAPTVTAPWQDRPRPTPADLDCEVLASGFGAGVLATERPTHGPWVALLTETPEATTLEAVRDAAALVVTRGNTLSHSASACREIGMPVVRCEQPLDALLGTAVLVNAADGRLTPIQEMPGADHKRGVFLAARQLAGRPTTNWRADDVYETVLIDPAALSAVRRSLTSVGAEWRESTQRIVPFDDPSRDYCGVSARLQTVGEHTRVQFKRANLLPDRPSRYDQSVHVPVADEESGGRLLSSLGYVGLTAQERRLLVAEHHGVKVCIHQWPNAPFAYLSIESATPESAVELLEAAGVSPDLRRAYDGRDLFDMMGLRLDRLTFERG